MRYNKVREILRARQGSQILKFQNPAGTINPNPFMVGSSVPIPKTIGPDPIGDRTKANIEAGKALILKHADKNKYFNSEEAAKKLASGFDKGDLFTKDGGIYQKWVKTSTLENSEESSEGLSVLGNKIGNFFLENPQLALNAFNMGLDWLGNKFQSDTYNNKGTETMFALGDVVGNAIPLVKIINTALKGINSILGKKADSFLVDKLLQEQAGGDYQGAFSFMSKTLDKAGKKYGLFSSGSRRQTNKDVSKSNILLFNIGQIRDEAQDLFAMSGNDTNYLRWKMQTDGYLDLRNLLVAKQGGKLEDKICLIKSRKFNQVINVNTKQVEGFKEGGNLPELWEPIIDDAIDYWEPIIDDIELYREGGKTKERLETPEIEETNQKNLIPEGALHKNKHHMEHTEDLTQKGIPVIDNEGELQAEIELDEIIFTLEVTKKLEELYKDGSDEAAIDAGKLLVKEILFNTDDRTGLITKCEKGGKL